VLHALINKVDRDLHVVYDKLKFQLETYYDTTLELVRCTTNAFCYKTNAAAKNTSFLLLACIIGKNVVESSTPHIREPTPTTKLL
jgi:hypothetical protein